MSGSIHRTYDNFFRVASESVSGGQAVSFQYDADGLLTAAGALAIQRDASTGFVIGSTLGSVGDSHSYSAYGEEASYTASFKGSSLYSVTYTRDALGRIATKTEQIGAEPAHAFSYGYDLASRLADVSKDGTPTAHYAYDSNGNRLAGPGLTASSAYDAQDRLLTFANCSYAYKPDGSLQTKTCPGGTTAYDYDAFGNLRHVTLPSGTAIEYIIDGQNLRAGKRVNGVTAEGFLYRTRLQPAAWLDGTGAVKATFIYGLHPNVPEYMVQGTTTYRLITDQVGSVRLVVNTSTGAVVERIDWDEFGNLLIDSAPGFQPLGFAGGLLDRDTGLTRFGARDYDSETGRWTSNDPIGFEGGLNFHEYSNNDPVNGNDPAGLYNTFTHWNIIIRAFPKTSERNQFLDAQVWADYAAHQQDDDVAYRHAMPSPRGSPIDAYFDTQKYIRDKKNCAIALEKAGRHSEAMFQLGLGMHTIMDSFSPAHRPYQPNPTPGLDLLMHVFDEAWASTADRNAAVAALKDYYASFRAGL